MACLCVLLCVCVMLMGCLLLRCLNCVVLMRCLLAAFKDPRPIPIGRHGATTRHTVQSMCRMPCAIRNTT